MGRAVNSSLTHSHDMRLLIGGADLYAAMVEAIDAAQAAFTRGLAKVTAINDDRLLRLYRAVIDAVLQRLLQLRAAR